jgi:hypothetical protein
MGPGIDMAVLAGLIADIAQIDLQGVNSSSRDRREFACLKQWENRMHRSISRVKAIDDGNSAK